MAKHSLEHQLSSLNLSIRSYDSLYHLLGQSHALAHVALSEHFQSCDHSVIYYYLSVLEEVVTRTRNTLDNEFKTQGDTIKGS